MEPLLTVIDKKSEFVVLNHSDFVDISYFSITQCNSIHHGRPTLLGPHFSINGDLTLECWDTSPTISLLKALHPLLVRWNRQEVGRSRRGKEKPSRTTDFKARSNLPCSYQQKTHSYANSRGALLLLPKDVISFPLVDLFKCTCPSPPLPQLPWRPLLECCSPYGHSVFSRRTK